MNLLNPKNYGWETLDPESRELMLATIDFFERKGKAKLREDDRDRIWYADFLAFVKERKAFATLMTPAGYGGDDARWDTWRNCAFNEILGFYGLPYWYTWQVTMLGLGPIWMGDNEAVKERTAQLLQEGGIFSFGLSEQEHGADIYATDMVLTPRPEDEEGGGYLANGSKYYIGNANEAAIVSTFGRTADSDEYVFFAADPRHPQYELVKNIVNSKS
jgi:acyl-CoA dehydrogenase